MSIGEVTECIRIDLELNAQPFFKGAPVSLPNVFVMEKIAVCLAKVCLKTFPLIYSHERNYLPLNLKSYTNIDFSANYSANVIRYALFLRYTSTQSFKILLEDFPLQSLSLLSKNSKGKIDAIKYAQALKKYGKISEDICLLFDEMYL